MLRVYVNAMHILLLFLKVLLPTLPIDVEYSGAYLSPCSAGG